MISELPPTLPSQPTVLIHPEDALERANHEYRNTRWLFLRALGLIYLFAFASLIGQIQGLIGQNGIVPVADILPLVQRQYAGLEALRVFPTLFWLNASDAFLLFLCIGGVSLSILLMLRVMPFIVLPFLWLFYLSLVVAGQVFLSFQWDILLLETGFLAILLAPIALRPSVLNALYPSTFVIWMFRWLLFRLVFASGMVKLMSNDPTWRDLTALNYHYWTQPIPNAIAWYVHQLPLAFQQLSTLAVFFAELIVPFFYFAPRRFRIMAAFVTMGFQGLIFATGNYTYFNLLTIVLCIPLLDDTVLRCFRPRWRNISLAQKSSPSKLRKWAVITLATPLLIISCLQFADQLNVQFVPPVYSAIGWIRPLRLVNTYGLFAVMTTERREIIMEGSSDGVNWIAYTFRFKPQDINRAPPFVAPYQPRLDWQMWFAALGTYQQNPWFLNFVKRLLEGSAEVVLLLENNPFPDDPPRYIRAQVYDYTFTNWMTRNKTGTWWERSFRGEYMPPVSLGSFR